MFLNFYLEGEYSSIFIDSTIICEFSKNKTEIKLKTKKNSKILKFKNYLFVFFENFLEIYDFYTFKHLKTHFFSRGNLILHAYTWNYQLLVVLNNGHIYNINENSADTLYFLNCNSIFSCFNYIDLLFFGSYNKCCVYEMKNGLK